MLDERQKQRRTPIRYCKMCNRETENGCPDCRAYLCNPYVRDCYEVHILEVHERSQVG
jgi:hypothetical protein